MKGFPTALSTEVVASVNGYERREMDGEAVLYHLKADKATTFSDAHQELENVHLQVFNGTETADDITAEKAVYIPEENKNFKAFFAGAVTIKTRDELTVKTEQVTYTSSQQSAVADEDLTFERGNVRGGSFGGVVNIASKTLELSRDVRVEVNGGESRLNAGSAVYDHQNETVSLQQGVEVHSIKDHESTELRAARASVRLSGDGDAGRSVATVELHENVTGRRSSDVRNSELTAGYAFYDRPNDRFDLKHGAVVTMPTSATKAAAHHIVYEPSALRAAMNGGAEITRGSDLVKAQVINAGFYGNQLLENAKAKGDAFLRRVTDGGTAEITSAEFTAVFSETGELREANAVGHSILTNVPSNAGQYNRVVIDALKGIDAAFGNAGLMQRVRSDGRTTIKLETPDNGRDSSNKQISADSVVTSFGPDGKSLARAEGVGNAELIVEPHRAAAENYLLNVRAARFDCDFFSTGSQPRACVGSNKTRAVRKPTVARDGRGDQVMTADRMTAVFGEQSRTVERLDADGNAKFTEMEDNAVASTFSFTTRDEVLRLRGGEPTAWNNAARIKAREIDWNTRDQRSFYRGPVSTTYYSQNATNNATPFGNGSKPVYLTAQSVEIDHRTDVAVYSGSARSWQGNNYVRGDRLVIDQQKKMMSAAGSVASLLYDAKRRQGGGVSSVPVYASARAMTYDSNSRIIRYEDNVDIRQGTDRISGEVAVIHLGAENDLTRSEFQTDVIVIQPRRKAFASSAVYTSENDTIVLRGNPARIEDNETGTAQGSELVLNLRDNRFSGEGKTRENPAGRIRSVYRLKTN